MEKTSFYFDHKPKLKGEYLKTFEEVEEYFKLEIMDPDAFGDSMNYLMDVFLTAQDKGMSVKKITGDNIESFCKSFISDTARRSVPFIILEMVRRIAYIVIFLMLIFVILPRVFFDGVEFGAVMLETSDYWLSVLIGVAGGVAADVAADIVYKHIIFKLKKYRKFYHALLNIIWVAIFIGVIMLVPIYDEAEVSFGVSNGTFLMICAGVLICCHMIYGLINKSNGKPFFSSHKRSEEKISFSTSVMRSMVSELRNMYDKGNVKLMKKGKEILTHEQFMEKFFKDTRKMKKGTIAVCIITAAIYVAFFIQVALTSTLIDTAIFIVMLSVIYILIMWSITIYPYLTRQRLADILQKNGKSIFDDDVLDYIE